MKKKTNAWETLTPNDIVEIVAPASASTEEKIYHGLTWLKNIGLVPQYPNNMIQTDLYFAAPLDQQWEHFKKALYSDAKVIWCLRGGYGSMRLIPLLEKLTPPKTPKLLIGFSDITALHIFFNQKWNWPTLHARTISQLHPDWELTEEHQSLVDLLFGRINQINFKNLTPLNQAAEEVKTLEGTILGGNLRIIQSSLGTSWEIKPKGKIQHVDGLSLVPIIQRKNSNQNRFFTWHYPHMRTNGSPDIQPFSAIRQGDWKLIFFHKDQHFELYNTRTDLSEKNNLFTSRPEKGQFLAKKLGEKLRSSNSKMLIDKEKQKEIIYPF